MSQFAQDCPGFSISGNPAVQANQDVGHSCGEFLTPKRRGEQEMVPWLRKGEDRSLFPSEKPRLLIGMNSAFGSRPFKAANAREIPALK